MIAGKKGRPDLFAGNVSAGLTSKSWFTTGKVEVTWNKCRNRKKIKHFRA
jgi:hypothetical protein